MARNLRREEREIWVTWEEYDAQKEELRKLKLEVESKTLLMDAVRRRLSEVEDKLRKVAVEKADVEFNIKALIEKFRARGLRPVTPEEYRAERSEYMRTLASYRWAKHFWGHYTSMVRANRMRAERLRARLPTAPDWEKPSILRELERAEAAARRYTVLAREYLREMRRLEREIPRLRSELKAKTISIDMIWYEYRLRELEEERERLFKEEISLRSRLAEVEWEAKELSERLRVLEEEHGRKKVYRKLIAVHKRWQYESRRKGHDIMIEAIGTAIISYGEDEYRWISEIKDMLWDEVAREFAGGEGAVGWESLKGALIQETVGVQVKYTKLPPRGFILEKLKWTHTIRKVRVGVDEKGNPIYRKIPILSLRAATAKYPFVKVVRVEGEET